MKPFAYRVLLTEVGLLAIIGAAPLPYAFYGALRLILSVAAGFLIARIHATRRWIWYHLPLSILGLFPAFMNVEMPKSSWIVVDLVIGGLLIICAQMLGVPMVQCGLAKSEEESYREAAREKFSGDLRRNEEQESDFADEATRPHLEHDSLDRKNVFIAVTVALVVATLIFTSVSGSSSTGCTSYVDDGHGGYCDSYE